MRRSTVLILLPLQLVFPAWVKRSARDEESRVYERSVSDEEGTLMAQTPVFYLAMLFGSILLLFRPYFKMKRNDRFLCIFCSTRKRGCPQQQQQQQLVEGFVHLQNSEME